MVTAILCIVAAVILVYKIIFNRRKKLKKYPPGPWRLPVLGNLISIGDKIHLAFMQYAQIHGPIFSVKMGNQEAVVLHGAKLIREAFKNPVFDGRPSMEAAELFLSGNKLGIMLGVGRSWSDQRRFALRHLRDFGFGKNSIESQITVEVTELIEWIAAQNGKPIQLRRRFSLAVINVLWRILSGNRYDHDDPRLIAILDQFETMAHACLGGKGKSLLIYFYPKIAKMFPNLSGWNNLIKILEPRVKLFTETIQEHENTFQEGHPRDFIDLYLQEAKNTQNTDSIFHKKTARDALQSVVADFFVGGSDTTSTMLNWNILYLLHHKDVQVKLQNEIDRVVGNSRLPSLADRKSLPYTEAYIMELLRITAIASFGVPHAVTEDVEFHGYHIPKGTSVYASIYSTHHDPEVWGDPECFRPERFLSEDGSKTQNHESLIPFAIGRRSCLGELLARDQLFLFVTSIAQRFNVSCEIGKPMPTLDIVLGKLTLEPHHYAVVLESRF